MIRFNYKWLLLLAFFIVFPIASSNGAAAITYISTAQLKDELAKPGVIVIDVRVEHEWNSSDWKIRGARRESPRDVSEWMSKYQKSDVIVLYCD